MFSWNSDLSGLHECHTRCREQRDWPERFLKMKSMFHFSLCPTIHVSLITFQLADYQIKSYNVLQCFVYATFTTVFVLHKDVFLCVHVHMWLSPVQICLRVHLSRSAMEEMSLSLPRRLTTLLFFYSGSFWIASTTVQPHVKNKANSEQLFEKIWRFKKKYTVRSKKTPESKDHSPFKLILWGSLRLVLLRVPEHSAWQPF